MEKLKTALYFGADAVYVGGKQFSLRAYADNFSNDELKVATDYVHKCGKKIYVTLNIFAKNNDLEHIEKFASYLLEIGVDAALTSDPGVFSIVKKAAPSLPIHISTQANVTNKECVKFWRDLGASRVVLARELSIKEIESIHRFVPDIELEAFVHGAMCISYSGRCLLSKYLTGRDANRGECAQACRWRYFVRKKDDEGDTGYLPVEEDDRGTYIFNSKDLNMSAHLDDLKNAGVVSFKIEGRMKSEYYLATVINAYRRCLDFGFDETVSSELLTASNRQYTTAYAYGENANGENACGKNACDEDSVNFENSQAKGDCDFIANVLGCDKGFALVEMRSRFKVGDTLEILSPNENFGKSFVLKKAYLKDGTPVEDCKLVQGQYALLCPYKLRSGDIIRRRK